MTKIVQTPFTITYNTRPNSFTTTMKCPAPIKTEPGRSRTAIVMINRATRYRGANRARKITRIQLVSDFKYPSSLVHTGSWGRKRRKKMKMKSVAQWGRGVGSKRWKEK